VGKVAKVGGDRVNLRQEQSAPVLAELHEKFLDWEEQIVARECSMYWPTREAKSLSREQGLRE
jgi:hypothetical protein